MPLSATDIIQLYERRANQQYGGEAITQLEHALQCAQLAEHAGETTESVVAALLHDLGHLITPNSNGIASGEAGHDDLHQYLALPFVRHLLPNAVLEPIRLHVDAKRYLCGIEPGYWASLSPASQHSLVLQGGPMRAEALAAFLALPFAPEAIRLRRYDDHAKVQAKSTPNLAYFESKLLAVAI